MFNISIKFKKNLKVQQVFILFAVTIISIPLSLISSILITKYLGAEKFGDFSFLTNIFNFSILINESSVTFCPSE